jgi:hypothetical protein
MEKSTNINVDPLKLLRPLISATLLNAYFSSLIVKKLSGEELTVELKKKTLADLVELFGIVDHAFFEALHGVPFQSRAQESEDPD